MITSTAQSLYNIYNNGGGLSNGILHDLFGINNFSNIDDEDKLQEYIDIIDGLYNGLWKMNTPVIEIEQAFKKNKLDNLINSKYKNSTNKNYIRYIKNNIKIGNTFYNLKAL